MGSARARWTYLQNSAKQPTIGKIVDDAMVAIERDNQRLKGILPKDYARATASAQSLCWQRIQVERPQVVVDAVEQVGDAVRNSK